VQGSEYTTGVPEEGVVCGDTTCALATDSCCVGLVPGTAPVCAPAGTCTPFSTIEVPCDGSEDCAPTAECCRVGFAVQCVEGGCAAGGGDKVCVNTPDCGADNTCCTSDLLATAGVDAGICQPTANNCAATLPPAP